jgi:hypothetical protein
MRSALVRALLQARRRDLPADAPPAGLPWYPAAPGSLEGGAAASAILASDLGLCLARRHWRNVVAIVEAVDAKTESFNFGYAPEETEASKRESALVESELAKIIPSIAGCFPAGAKLRIDRRRLRSLLEEAAYHMTNGPAASGPASGDRQGGAR